MSNLSDSIDQLYSHFLLRDVLAKAIPGFLALLLILAPPFGRQHDMWLITRFAPPWIVAVLTYGLSFMVGMMLQFLAQTIGLIRIHVWDEDGKPSAELSLQKAKQFVAVNAENYSRLRIRERYAILKEMSGSYCALASMSAALVLISPLTSRVQPNAPWLLAIAVIALVAFGLAKQNRYHAKEQRIWESEATSTTPARQSLPPAPRKRATKRR